MAEPELTPELLEQFEELSAQLAKLPFHQIWTDYDAEVDCLYINFANPKGTTDSEGLDNGMIIDYRGANEEVVGVTVLDASKRGAAKAKVKKVKA